MVNRPRQTLMDYMVIGISPALIMAMVGSLLFYLLEVFYRGQYQGRLTFIFAMFVMAIVLIARISMEEGIEYATLFAIPLAIVTLLALSRFVHIQGDWAGYSLLVNMTLIAVVWWSAHKLTWDCTWIDDSEDSSGEGLLQGMGFDSDTVASQAATRVGHEGAAANSADTQPRAGDGGVAGWWNRMLKQRRRPHAPGVWIIYYALAALPLFLLGRWFLPADSPGHRRAFGFLFVYVGSALGLLLTTSFLGLRRYLRQRNLEMPGDMAASWLGLGGILIMALLLFALLLPRPGATVRISQLPVTFGSPIHKRTHPAAVGQDGPEQTSSSARTRPDTKQPGDITSDTRPSSGQKGQSGPRDASGPADDSGSESPARQPDNAAGKDPSAQRSVSDRSPDAPQDQPTSPTQVSRPADRSPSSRPRSAANQPQPQQPQPQQPQPQQPQGREEADAATAPSAGDQAASSGTASAEKSPTAPRAQAQREPDNGGQPSGRRSEGREAGGDTTTKPAEPDGGAEPTSAADRSSSLNSLGGQLMRTLGSGIGALLKLLLWMALAVILIYFAWKYREQVLQALRQLRDDLRRLWSLLFGRERDKAADSGAEMPAAEAARHKPFAAFRDPFVAGDAKGYSMEQLVCYTYDAFEAWARERACPRAVEQTPLEFAQQVAREHPQVALDAQRMADLYSRIVYGRERISSDRRQVLSQLWQQMRLLGRAPVPPVPPVPPQPSG